MRADGEPGAVKRFAAEIRRAVVILFLEAEMRILRYEIGYSWLKYSPFL
jgi:hypothetical protein